MNKPTQQESSLWPTDLTEQETSGPQLSAQASNRLLHFEDCQAAIDQLFVEALNTHGLPAFHQFLNFVQQFNNLSVYNAMLVKLQRPGASAVGTRRQWKEKGRYVKPDAVPIVILKPFGPVSFVFEVSDTYGCALLRIPAMANSCSGGMANT